ncbi:TNF receptor-associated factor 3-like [Antedon mediterranea]|uniref:TNF receptor-associated factor 3-like n=1 Tax=Antedon mediterranea TaxID=105859 RepID=UPI003AF68A81
MSDSPLSLTFPQAAVSTQHDASSDQISNLLALTHNSFQKCFDSQEVEFIEGSILDDLRCVLCRRPLLRAQQAPCGCRFCSCILNQTYDDFENTVCPNCNEEFNKKELAPDHHARRQIQRAIVYCPHKDNGCIDTFPLKELKEHVEGCLHSPVVCMHHTRGCQAKLLRKDLMEHLKNTCDYRLVKCQYCSESLPHTDVQEHEKSCSKLPVNCPNNCGQKDIQKDLIEQHIDEYCPLQEKTCKYQPYGCTFKGVLEQLEKHMDVDVKKHLHLVTMTTAMLDLKFSESLRYISELKGQRSVDDEKEKELLREINSIKNTLKVKDERFGSLQKFFGKHLDNFKTFEAKVENAADKRDLVELRQLLIPLQDSVTLLARKVEEVEENAHRAVGVPSTIRPITNGHGQIASFEKELNVQSVKQAENEIRFQLLETASYDGVLLWKISGISRRRQEAVNGKILSLYSQPFYTSRYGYKMCARIYLNGDGMGKGTHVSLFFVVMKGDYDALQQWPFRQKVTMILLDQETGTRSLTDSFKPDVRSSSFKRPTGDMNVASGCPLFVSNQVLRDSAYVKDDTMFVKLIVDTSDLFI